MFLLQCIFCPFLSVSNSTAIVSPIPRQEIVMGTKQDPTVLQSWELGTGLVWALQILELERDVDACGSHDVRMIKQQIYNVSKEWKDQGEYPLAEK